MAWEAEAALRNNIRRPTMPCRPPALFPEQVLDL